MIFARLVTLLVFQLARKGLADDADSFTPNLSSLDGLSTEEMKEKLMKDPLLMSQLLDAAGVEREAIPMDQTTRASLGTTGFGNDVEGTCSAELGSMHCPRATQINITSVPYRRTKYNSPHGLEYLGLGYNALTGNPRGSDTSELDPGFGFPVIDLSAKNEFKWARGFGMPDVTYLKGSKTCSFSSEATDMSSTKDYQDTLNKESSSDTSASVGGSFFGFEFNVGTSFSKSTKFERFRQERESTQTISLEASALCIDYSIGIHPYETIDLDPDFTNAIGRLSTTYDGTDDVRAEYGRFLNAYGTHYITQMDMGGKYVITSEMSTKDALRLTRRSIDVARTLSFEASFGFKQDEPTSDSQAKRDFVKPQCCGGELKSPDLKSEQYEGLFGGGSAPPPPFSINVSAKNTRKTKETSSMVDNDSVREQITKMSKYVLGGLPPTDEKWETWAASVSSNPMPVAYRYLPIWNIPQFAEYREAYIAAVFDIYGVDLVGTSEFGEPAFRYGVARSTGEAISQYSRDPDRRKRAYLELDLLSAVKSPKDTITVFIKEEEIVENPDVVNHWSQFVGPSNEGYFACGLRGKWDMAQIGRDDKGLAGLDVCFCSIEEWSEQEEKAVYRDTYGNFQPWIMCDTNQYIVQIRPWTREVWDNLGIETLEIKCASIDGTTAESFYNEGFKDIVPNPKRLSDRLEHPEQPETIIAGKLLHSLRVQFSDDEGIKGLEVQMGDATAGSGPSSPIYFYSAFWNLYSSVVSPIFSTPIRGKASHNAFEAFRQLSFTNTRGQLTIESAAHYNFMDNPTRPKIAVTDFKAEIEESDLPSFSFLIANDLPIIFPGNKPLVAGIVHPDGYGISSSLTEQLGFYIRVEDEEKPNLVTVVLTNISEREEHIHLLVSPLWFPNLEARYPTNVGDVTVAPTDCEKVGSDWKCSVHVGTLGNSASYNNLGFSFLAVGNTVDLAQHGHVSMNGYDVDASASVLSARVSASPNFSATTRDFTVTAGNGDSAILNLKNQRTGGVLLTFDPPFEAIPSIIVSPVLSKEGSLSRYDTDIVNIPTVVVEHVTESEALVRAGVLDTYTAGVSAFAEACDSASNIHQSWSLRYNVVGQINLAGNCLEWDGEDVDAVACGDTDNQRWVFDGEHIRPNSDLSKCVWGVNNGAIQLHECRSNSNNANLDDEGFKFRDDNLVSDYGKCLRLEGTKAVLRDQCHASDSIVIVESGFATSGFQILASDDVGAVSFSKCFSVSETSKTVTALGTCENEHASWLVQLSESDRGDLTYKLKLANQFANDPNVYYLQVSGGGLSVGTETSTEFDLRDTEDFLYLPAEDEDKLTSSRIKISGTNNCIAWERNLGTGVFEVQGSVWEPVSFNFFAIAPQRASAEEEEPVSPPNVEIPAKKSVLKGAIAAEKASGQSHNLRVKGY